MFPTTHVFTFATPAPPWDVWAALTVPEQTAGYLEGLQLVSDFATGSAVSVRLDGTEVGTGEVLAADPYDRLVYTFEGGTGSDTYLTWSVRNIPTGSIVRLYVDEVDGEHDEVMEELWLPVLRRLQGVLSQGRGVRRTTAG